MHPRGESKYASLIECNHPSLSSISTKFVNFHQLKKNKRLELVDRLIHTPKKQPSQSSQPDFRPTFDVSIVSVPACSTQSKSQANSKLNQTTKITTSMQNSAFNQKARSSMKYHPNQFMISEEVKKIKKSNFDMSTITNSFKKLQSLNAFSHQKLPTSGKLLSPKGQNTILHKNKDLMNRAFKIICRDPQYNMRRQRAESELGSNFGDDS